MTLTMLEPIMYLEVQCQKEFILQNLVTTYWTMTTIDQIASVGFCPKLLKNICAIG